MNRTGQTMPMIYRFDCHRKKIMENVSESLGKG